MGFLKLTTLNDIYNYFEENQGKFYFRGYRESEKYQIPTLGRDPEFKKNELLIIQIFANNPFIASLGIKTLHELLEYGQHYGLPTRLIDWTEDPFVALFFAIGKPEDIDKNLAIKIALLSKTDTRILENWDPIEGILDDYDNNSLADMDSLSLNSLDDVDPIEIKIKGRYFYKRYLKFLQSEDDVLLFRKHTNVSNPRRDAQSGLFTFHKNVDQLITNGLSFDEIEIDLRVEEFKTLVQNLKAYGYTEAHLLPESDTVKSIVEKIKKDIKT